MVRSIPRFASSFLLPMVFSSVALAGAAEVGTGEPPVASYHYEFWDFLKLGIEHILMGYDHLLFLFGLLIVVPRFRSIIVILTAFTFAHSLTLILSTLNVVQISSHLIEPLIAATIVSVGLENLLVHGEQRRFRWAIAFVFGLIHGFGFATILLDLGLGRDGKGLVLPLLTFNLGVEIGQVVVASIVLPLLWCLRSKPSFVRWGVPTLSWIVTLTGSYWLLERTILH